jgi:hypothetical protein
MIEAVDKLKKVKDVMNELLDGLNPSSHGRTLKKQIRLSLDAINQITPGMAQNADAIVPISNVLYACRRQARKEKQETKMLAASDGWTVIGHSSRLLLDTRTANMQQQHCLFSILAMLGQFSNHNIPFKQKTTEKDECSILSRNINAMLATQPGLYI